MKSDTHSLKFWGFSSTILGRLLSGRVRQCSPTLVSVCHA